MKPESFSTPILFLIFNRPDTTSQVFNKIREIRPKYLFVSADGPRQNKIDDEQKCRETRNIIKKIDWECKPKTNYSEKNLGCRVGVSSGINWFFNQVTEGIILEDDCLPDLSFFHFCESLLEYYRNDERIMHIGGVNFQDGRARGSASYYFSRICHVWGWATWKRAWDKYDVNVTRLHAKENRWCEFFPDRSMRKFWQKKFELVYNKEKDTWDYQWQYASSVNNGLAIIPSVNLISNIGFEGEATHTTANIHMLANRPTKSIGALLHPAIIEPDRQADEYTFRKYTNPNKLRKLWQLFISYLKQHMY
jgi:hypothetical protein